MDLMQRYVDEVRALLPKEQQQDIVEELTANLQAQMEDREAELGRPLSEAEQEAILQRHGHPMIVAGRYLPHQGGLVFGRELISASLFPFYVRTLQFVMGISLAILLIVLIMLAVSGTPLTVGSALNVVLLQVCIQFGVITCIFVALERYAPTITWDARHGRRRARVSRSERQVPRVESLAQIIATVAMVVWGWAMFSNPSLIFGSAVSAYQLGSVWGEVVPAVLLILGVSVAQAVVNLARPDWMRLPMVVRVLTDIAGLGVVVYLLSAAQWIVPVSLNAASPDALSAANDIARYGLWFTAIAFVIVILYDAWRLLSSERQRAKPAPAAERASA